MLPEHIRDAFNNLLTPTTTASWLKVKDWLDFSSQIPKPDWSAAPSWAEWWAVNADGREVFFSARPVLKGNVWTKKDIFDREFRFGYVELQFGVDWRITLQRKDL